MLQALSVDMFLCKSLFSFLLTCAHISNFNESYHSVFLVHMPAYLRDYNIHYILFIASKGKGLP